MTDTIEIVAEHRERIGKSSRILALSGKLPAVVYGTAIESQAIEVDRHTFEQIVKHGSVSSTLFKLAIDGGKPINVMVKEMKHHPLKGTIEHVDFWAINMRETVATTVPVAFVGDSVGEKEGGVVIHEMREIHIEALPTDLPDSIEVDVSDLEIGQAFHVSSLVAPKGVTILDDPEAIVCAVTAPTKAVEDEEAAEAGAVEPMLVGEDTEGTEDEA